MHHAFDAMRDGRGVRREEARIETLDAAGWRDGARNQEQAGRIGQEARIRKRFPGTFELWRRAFGPAPETEAGFLAGLADRGNRERLRARGYRLRAALEQIGFELRRDRRRHR